MVNLTNFPRIVEAINAVLTNGGIAEIKTEGKNGIVVVEIKRTLKTTKQEPNNTARH